VSDPTSTTDFLSDLAYAGLMTVLAIMLLGCILVLAGNRYMDALGLGLP
jgi:hypothetical protein